MDRSEFSSEPRAAKVFIVALLVASSGLFAWSLYDRFVAADGSSRDTAFVFLTAAILTISATPFAPTRTSRIGAGVAGMLLLVAFFAAR